MKTQTFTGDNTTVVETTTRPQLKGKLLTVYIKEDGTFIFDEETADFQVETLEGVKQELKALVSSWEELGTEGLKEFISDTYGWVNPKDK